MRPCSIKISSKNQNSILKFSFLIFKKLNFKLGSKLLLKNYFKAHKKKKIFTILKSPHVNKKAQEQFEFRVFSQQLIMYTNYDIKLIHFLKKLNLQLFPDIKLKIKFFIKKSYNFKTKPFKLCNYKLQPHLIAISNNNIFKNKIQKSLVYSSKHKTLQQLIYWRNRTLNLKKSSIYLNILNLYGKTVLEKS